MKSAEGSPFDCGACSDKDREARNCFNTKRLSEEAIAVTEYTGPVIEELRERNIPKVLSLGGIRLYECPLSYITDETIGIIRAVFLMDETGHLFFSGGWGEQPCWLVEAAEVYRNERARLIKGQRDA